MFPRVLRRLFLCLCAVQALLAALAWPLSANSAVPSGAAGSSAALPTPAEPVWQSLAPGLELTVVNHKEPQRPDLNITMLRIDPEKYDFSLHSVVWEGGPPRTLQTWAEERDLIAVVNAGMYLPDGRTSTGYMRQGEHANNTRIAEKYGSFFVAGPRKTGLPRAAVLDRARDDWQTLLPHYDLVVQNFRLLGPEGAQLWPENGPLHAVAAVGMDSAGRILFLHCRQETNVHGFVRALLACPGLDLSSAMYVEGGAQAAMAALLPDGFRLWTGRGPADLLPGVRSRGALLPNILGVRPRQDASAP